MEFDITGNVKLNTQQASQDLNSFMGTVNNSMPPMIGTNESPSIMDGAQYQNTKEHANQLNDSFGNLKDQMEKVLESFKSLCVSLDETANKAGVDFTKVRKDHSTSQSQQNKNVPSTTGQVRNVVGVLEGGSNVVSNVANGNIGGAMISGVSNAGSTLMQGAGAASTAGLSALAGTLGVVGGLILGGAAVMKGGNALATKYEDVLPEMDDILTTYGTNVHSNSREMNVAQAMTLRNEMAAANKGTGLKTSEFVRLTNSLGEYGFDNSNRERAMEIARQGAIISGNTGVDASKIVKFGGLVERYGGNATESMDAALRGAKASGLEDRQFGEFFDGLSKVIENGISKGFINSTEDVSKNLSTLAELSGSNPLWQGKEGANRYMQMSNSVSSKTDLQSTSSILLARTANDMIKTGLGKDSNYLAKQLGENSYLQGDSVLNTMAFIEKGNLSPEFLKAYGEKLNNTFGDDVDSKVANIKETYGLNWQGSIQLYNMFDKLQKGEITNEEFSKQTSKITADKEFQSDNKQMIQILDEINNAVINLGQPAHEIKMAGLGTVENLVSKIYSAIITDPYKIAAKDSMKGFFSIGEGNQKTEFINKISEEINAGNYGNVDDMLTWMLNADKGTKDWYNAHNNVMDLFDPQKRELHSNFGPENNNSFGSALNLTIDDLETELSNPDFVTTEGEEKLRDLLTNVNQKYNYGRGLSESEYNKYITEKQKYLDIANKYVTSDYDPVTKSGWQFNSDGIINELRNLGLIVQNTQSNVVVNMPYNSEAYYRSLYAPK